MPTIQFGELPTYYEIKGKGKTLILFPDNLFSSRAYIREIEHFAESFQVLAIDYPRDGKIHPQDDVFGLTRGCLL
jgi:hypothetical protein